MMYVPFRMVSFVYTSLQYLDCIIASEYVGKCQNSSTFSIQKGIKVNSFYAIESLFSLSAYGCAEHCLRRKICKSSSFLPNRYICYLNTVVLSDLTAVKDISALYIPKAETRTVSIL